jgi:hypothetical protein
MWSTLLEIAFISENCYEHSATEATDLALAPEEANTTITDGYMLFVVDATNHSGDYQPILIKEVQYVVITIVQHAHNEPVSDSGIKSSRPWCVPVLLLSRMPLSFLKTILLATTILPQPGSVTHFNASGPITCRTKHKTRSSPTGFPPYTTAPPHAYLKADTALLPYNDVAALP